MTKVESIAVEFMRRGGKRLRPRLLKAVYRRILPDGNDDLSALTDAIECFHKASLIHDDIQDGDATRDGAPTVWREHGVPLAIAAGDWLLAYGIARVADADFPNVADLSKATSRAILQLCEGQGDELAGSADYVSVCERKTGSLFALAAELGALAAGADPAPYREWGLAYGVLFQIRDDLRDEGDSPRLRELAAVYERRLAALGMESFL